MINAKHDEIHDDKRKNILDDFFIHENHYMNVIFEICYRRLISIYIEVYYFI